MTTRTTAPYSILSTKKKQSRNRNTTTTATATAIQVQVGANQLMGCPMTPEESAEYLKVFSSNNNNNNNDSNSFNNYMNASIDGSNYNSGDLQMILDQQMDTAMMTSTSLNNSSKKKNSTSISVAMMGVGATGTTMDSNSFNYASQLLPSSSSWFGSTTGSNHSSATGTKMKLQQKQQQQLHQPTSSSSSTLNATDVQQQMMMSGTLPFPIPITAQTAQAVTEMNQLYANYSMAFPSMTGGSHNINNNSNNASNLPCSEKEMKALMSMFVEIMSLQMNTDRLNECSTDTTTTSTTGNYNSYATTTKSPNIKNNKKKKNASTTSSNHHNSSLFQFPTNVPPPPQGWPECLAWPPIYELRGGAGRNNNNNNNDNDNTDYDDGDDSIDSLPALESIPIEDRPKMIHYSKEARTKAAALAAATTAAKVRYGAPNNNNNKPIVTTYTPMPPVPGCTSPILDMTGPVTGSAGIVPMEWAVIERTAIEDALEQEELLSMRLRKQNMNIDSHNKKMKDGKKKKQQQMFPSPNLPPEISSRTAASITTQEATIALQKVEEANRKLGKAVTMWRNRVATAVTQNEISKLELLLHESPLRTVTHMQQQAASVLSFHNNMNHNGHVASMGNNTNNNAMLGQSMNGVETVDDHLRYLVPLTVPKNFASMKSHHGSNSVARILLAQYIISEFSPNHFVIPGQNGRSVLHLACMMADISIIKLILEHAQQTLHPTIVCEVLMKRCHDSGWNAFHYAISSGSLRIIEAILQSLSGEDELIQKIITSTTNDTLTWKRGETVGLSPQFLACALLSYHPETRIETHGMALQEIVNHRIRNKTIGSHSTIDPSWYVAYLTQIAICLTLIQANGHVALDEAEIVRIERDTIKQLEESQLLERNNAAMASSNNNDNNNPMHTEDDKWMDSDDETSPTTTVEKKTTKSKKKKKKNKQQPNSGTASAAPASVSVSSKDAGESNNTDHKISDVIDPSDHDVTSVEESEVSKPSVTVITETSTDPLVTALLGMGFDHNAILDGIKACGGTLHATADDVVAWIFGGKSDNTNANANQADTMQQSSEQPRVSVPPTISKSANSYQENVTRVEALRRKEEEERIAAEKLAAKREEQRRRNREWNNREQARQIQETQEKIAKAAANTTTSTNVAPAAVVAPKRQDSASTIRAGIMPTSILQHNNIGATVLRGPSPSEAPMGFDSSLLAATPSRMAISAANRPAGRLNLGPSAADSYYDNAYGNDGSTIASSVDHGIIDIGGNDDATVSTIGSFPVVYPPAPASYAPPGFSNGPILPSMDGGHQPHHRGITQAQWEAHRSLSMSDSYAWNNNGTYDHSMGIGGLGITSMIPESSPVSNRRQSYYDVQSPSLNLPSQSNTLTSAFGSFSGTSADFAPGNSSLFGGGSTALMRNDGSSPQYGNDPTGIGSPLGYSMSSLRANPLERSMSANSGSAFLNETTSHNIPGLFGFGSDLNQKVMDSTIIDSISTGNTGIGGSSLWGSAVPESRVGGGGATSLLENLILNSTSTTPATDYQQHRDRPLFPTSNEIESQFPETSFLSKDAVSWDRNRLTTNNLNPSQEGTNSSSIW